jgi:tryptophan-rich sensory protein
LVLNLLWSVLFFGFRAPLAASIEIIVLFAAIILIILSFRKVDVIAAWLLVPYALWVAFAGALNMAIAFMNR